MAEALGLALDETEELEKNIQAEQEPLEAEEIVESKPLEKEAQPQEVHQFHDIPGKCYEGEVVFNEAGRVVDFVGAFGSTVAAHEHSTGGAPLEKVLGLYQSVVNLGERRRVMDDPENSFVNLVHTLRYEASSRKIETRITREQKKVSPEKSAAKNSPELSPAQLTEKTAVEALWNMATATVEAVHVESSTRTESSESKVVSIAEFRKVTEAQRAGIQLEGLRGRAPAAVVPPAQQVHVAREHIPLPKSTPTQNPKYALGLEEVLRFNGVAEDTEAQPQANEQAQTVHPELEALRSLRAA